MHSKASLLLILIALFLAPQVSWAAPDPLPMQFPCAFIQNMNWNFGGDGIGVVPGRVYRPSSTCNVADGPPPGALYPVVLFFHGNGAAPDDYDYLGVQLARSGFVVISPQAGGDNEPRARTGISYLNSLYSFWTWRAQLSTNIAVTGHSRGGEAAVTATRILRDDPAANINDYTVKALISLAPTDGNGVFDATSEENTAGSMSPAYLLIYGTRDDDVRGEPLDEAPHADHHFTGFALYDRAGTEASTEGLVITPGITKSMLFVYGATHRGFLDDCSEADVTARGLIGCANHKIITRGYFSAFLRWHVRGETAFEPYFNGEEMLTSLANAGVRIFPQYSRSGRRRVVDNFNHNLGQTNNLGGTVSIAPSVDAAIGDLWQLVPSSPHDTRGLRARWTGEGFLAPTIVWQIPDTTLPFAGRARDLTPFTHLSFRAGQEYGSILNDGTAKSFFVRLFTSQGWSSTVQVAAVAEIPAPQVVQFSPLNDPDPDIEDFTKSAMRTVRIPLSAFGAADLADVSQIMFLFTDPRSETGALVIDSLELVR